MGLQEKPVDPSLGPKRDEMGARAQALVNVRHRVSDEDRVLAARYIRRRAAVVGGDGWQNVLDALGLS